MRPNFGWISRGRVAAGDEMETVSPQGQQQDGRGLIGLAEPAPELGGADGNGSVPSSDLVPRRGVRPLSGRRLADLALLGLVVLALAFLWGRAWQMWFWLDEGIAVGIASHPFTSIPELLRQDGSPPLYYLLLNVWMSMFGSSEVATHSLSLVFALAVLPAALWAGWSLFGRRAGWMAVLLVALNPFVAYYATETRMYSLVVLLALLATATFLHAFVFHRRRYTASFVLVTAVLMYTHNWGVLFAVGAAVAALGCAVASSDRRRLLTDAALSFGALALVYAPWLPTLLYQRSQQIAPWAPDPPLHWVRDDVTQMLGGKEVAVALGLGAALGLMSLLRRPWSRTAIALLAGAVLCAVMLAGGWTSSVWAYRYLAAVVGPIVLLVAAGLAAGGRGAVAALWVTAFLAAPIAVKGPIYQKSNATAVARAASALLQPDDLVVSADLQLVPLMANDLPPGLRYATSAGPVPDENIVDWRNSMERLRQGDPASTLPPLLAALPVGAHVLVVCPPTDDTSDPGGLEQATDTQDVEQQSPGRRRSQQAASAQDTPPPDGLGFQALIQRRCEEVDAVVLDDPRFRVDLALEAPTGVSNTPVDGYVATKVVPTA